MDSDDEDMRDVSSTSSSSCGGGGGGDDGGFAEEPGDEGVMVMEVRWFEVDLEYEFDAPRWFDLAQEESPVEAAAAQLWFASAPSYPPSPLIAKMLPEDLGLQSLRSAVDINTVHCSKSSHECSSGSEQAMHQPNVPNGGPYKPNGRTPCYQFSADKRKPAFRTIGKGTISKGSTLMKPTASQLARQNRQLEVKNSTQSKKLVGVRSDRSTMSSNDCTYQASKRQRLERGHLNKIVATNQPELIHKNHEKNIMNSNSDHATVIPKLKITIPREPELATKLRAERSRILRAVPTNSKQLNTQRGQSTSMTQAASIRKVVQPSGRKDHQHASVPHGGIRSNLPVCTSNRPRQLDNVSKKPDECRDDLFKFRARPLDKKILGSKGDIGVFQSSKRNTTVPKEFKLSTSNKGKQAPLSELFNKLTLTAEAHRRLDRQAADLPNYITTKDCKENMIGNMHC
ncbi:protein TPX2-like isoform X2 [Oryza brachyantha]|uniref:TPX2 central domain-containing protein n=1 Tax=Oryza brachyantha TaxID=4533 RepID=J3MAY8_ORYBR|nr:protein TPX2-like isoform X2 [Oryza brachyantha]